VPAGEYAERIDNADELLDSFLETFADENLQVQLQLLTAVVKLFLKRPQGTQELVQKVLALSTQESDNPDLRDRGYIYWRLLLTDPAAAKVDVWVLCMSPGCACLGRCAPAFVTRPLSFASLPSSFSLG
jgi:AP-1 complex subunit beta-1